MNSITVGAIGELRVCADLLAKGDKVFRSVSASCSCDLVIIRNGILLRVEVKTGYIRLDGTYSVSTEARASNADILAVVLPEKIIYESLS